MPRWLHSLISLLSVCSSGCWGSSRTSWPSWPWWTTSKLQLLQLHYTLNDWSCWYNTDIDCIFPLPPSGSLLNVCGMYWHLMFLLLSGSSWYSSWSQRWPPGKFSIMPLWEQRKDSTLMTPPYTVSVESSVCRLCPLQCPAICPPGPSGPSGMPGFKVNIVTVMVL